jgi:hypothetical protein
VGHDRRHRSHPRPRPARDPQRPTALLARATIALLVAALGLEMRIAAVGIVATAALYAAMLVVAVAVRPVRRRNVALAWLMILIAVVALGSLLLLLGAARAGA